MRSRSVPMPTKRTDDVTAEILSRISAGEPYARIYRSDTKRFPHQTAWNDWLLADETLAIAHSKAREIGFDFMAAECLDIADDSSKDSIVDSRGNVKLDVEFAQRSKLRVWTRLQLLAKWDPKRYGERVTHAGDASAPISVENASEPLARELVMLLRGTKTIEHKP